MVLKNHKENLKKVVPHIQKFKESKFWGKWVLYFQEHDFYIFLKRLYIFTLVLILFFTVYHIGYARRIVPGVKVGEIFVGGLSYDQAVEIISKYESELDKTLRLTVNDSKYEIKQENIDLSYNVEATVSRAFELGRTGNLFIDTKDKLASLIKTIQIKSFYDVDEGKLSNEFARIKGEVNKEPVNSSFKLENNELKINPSSDGLKVNDQYLYDSVISALEKMTFRDKKLKTETLTPELTQQDLEKVYEEAKLIVFNKIKINYEDKIWIPTSEQMLEFVEINKNGNKVEVDINGARFESYANQIKQEVNTLPRGNVTSLQDNVVTGFQVTQKGKELDIVKLESDFKNAFLNKKDSVALSIKEIAELNDPSKYGIFSLIGEGSSKFVGSIPARIRNLTLSAARVDGVIVPPNATFSFNNSVGEISAATGYDTAYIISNGRTVLGEGGGVCQTSTTLFRAVLNAGLPVITRHPHAYRVGYYEQDQLAGLDAAVYQPSLDFQFKNDTPNHILIQAAWNTQLQTLEFKIYGTPDTRSVEISKPVVTNLVPPPEPLYQDDPTLEKGITKQVDWAAWGAQSMFTRKVTRNGETLFEDTFKSSYQPWRSVFLVGTKE